MLNRYFLFLKRIEEFSNENQLSQSDRKVLAILYTTVLSKLQQLTKQLGSTIVVNIGGYLKSVSKRFDKYREEQMKVLVDEQRKSYADGYHAKITQTLSLIEEVVQPGITQVELELQATANDLLDQIIIMQTAVENQEYEYKLAYEKMKNEMGFRHLFSAFKVASTLTSFMGVQGAAIGGLMGSLTNVGEQMALGDYTTQRPPIQLPPSIKDHASKVEAEAKKESKPKMEELEEIISVTRTAIKENPEHLQSISGDLDSLEKLVSDMNANRDKYEIPEYLEIMDQISKAEKKLLDSLDKKETNLKELVNNPGSSPEEKDKANLGINSITVIKNSQTLINLSFDIYKTYKNDKKELEKLAQMVRDAEKAVEDVKAYKESVENTLFPLVSNIAQDLTKVMESIESGQTSVSLAVTKWQVRSVLSDQKLFMTQFTAGLPQQEKFAHCVDKLSESMTVLIDLFDYIEKYNEHMEFADYLANIVSPDANGIGIDKEAAIYISKIDLALQTNVLLVEYDRAVFAFKQWIFPFAHLYMDDFNLPQNMSEILNPESEINSPDDLMNFLIPMFKKRVENLDQRMDEYKALSFGNIDVNLIKTEFNSSYQSSHPFFVWENAQNRDTIRSLFEGKRVFLKPNPQFCAGKDKTAVKFRVVELVPKLVEGIVTRENLKDELERVLNDFTVIMTHSGVSRYIFGKEEYHMVGDNATLRYNYERDSQGNRLGTNMVYDKVKEGDFIMSPFTVWTIKLIPAVTRRSLKYGFQDLQKFAQLVNLELVGIGTYVDEKDHFSQRKAFQVYQHYLSDSDFRFR